MANYLDRWSFTASGFRVGSHFGGGGSRTAFALDSAYSHRVSGDAIGIRILAPEASAINELYVMTDLSTGTRGNITLVCDIYNQDSSTTSRPGTTLLDSSTTTTYPSSDDMWVKFEFATPYTPTVGEALYCVIYSTAGAPGTDYPSILNIISGDITSNSLFPTQHSFQTTDGFATTGTAREETPHMFKIGSNYYGQPYTQTNNLLGSVTTERGCLFTLDEDVSIQKIFYPGSANYDKFRILKSTTAPGAAVGSGEYEYDLDSDTGETMNDVLGCKLLDSPITLVGGQQYRFTLTYSSNTSGLTGLSIEDYSSFSAMFDAFVDANKHTIPQGTYSDGAGGWTNTKSMIPVIGAYIQSFPLIDTPAVGNVQNDDTVRGVTGTLTLPATTDVKSAVQYGAGGTEFTGSYSAAGGGGIPVIGGRVARRT